MSVYILYPTKRFIARGQHVKFFGQRHMCLGPRHMCLEPGNMCPGQDKVIETGKSENFSVFDVKKWKFGDHLKRVLAKFQVNRSHPWGVNGPSKFAVFWKKNRFQRRKMKRRESSETCFGKVSCRSEPCLSGKRPFKVLKNPSLPKKVYTLPL